MNRRQLIAAGAALVAAGTIAILQYSIAQLGIWESLFASKSWKTLLLIINNN